MKALKEAKENYSVERAENPDYDGVKTKVTATVNKMASSVAATASAVADATKPGDNKVSP